MEADHGNFDLDDIARDVEDKQAAEVALAAFFAREGTGLRTRATADPVAQSGIGRGFFTRVPAGTRLRYETLLHAEAGFAPGGDHGYLIGPACSILEGQLDRLLATPARAVVGHLIDALRTTGENKQAEILDHWASGKMLTTLGTESVLLLAVRRAYKQDNSAVRDFLTTQYRSRYLALLTSKGLGRCLDRIRDGFRNPIAHAGLTFDAVAYERFVALVVGNRQFRTWDVRGPEPTEPDAESAVLHHHLSQSQSIEPAAGARADAVTRLLALQTPATSLLRVHLQVRRANAQRDVGVESATEETFRLGDSVRFGFRSNRRCHLTVIDIGTTGTVAVVWPNRWHQDTLVEGEQTLFLPRLEMPEFVYRLTGEPGVERLVAIGTESALGVPVLPPPGAAFRKLSPEEIHALGDELALRDSATWAMTTCVFSIGE